MGVNFILGDVTTPQNLQPIIADAYLVIDATGPFQTTDYAIPQLCLDVGCHY